MPGSESLTKHARGRRSEEEEDEDKRGQDKVMRDEGRSEANDPNSV